MFNAKKLAVVSAIGLATLVTPMVANAGTTANSQNPKLGCINIVVQTFGSNGHILPITQQFRFTVDGNKTIANSDFTHTGRFPVGMAKVTAWNLTQPATHTVVAHVPAGWELQPKGTETRKLYVRGFGLHGCSATTFRFVEKPVNVKKVVHKKVVVTQVVNTTPTTKSGTLPDTGAGDAAAGVLGISGLGVAGRAYLRSRKGLLSAFLK